MRAVPVGALLVASLAALPLLSGGEARAQASSCTAAATVSDAADSAGVYTTTLVCVDTEAADDEADYTHLPYYSQGRIGSGLPNYRHRDDGIDNNDRGNHLRMTIGNGVVFSGTNAGPGASDQRTIVLESEGDLTFTVEEGGVIRANQALPNSRWNVGAGLYLVTDTGDLTVKHAGVIELDHSFPSLAVVSSSSDPPRPSDIPPYPGLTWNNYGSDGNGISVVAADRHFYGDAVTTYDANDGNGVNGGDILIELASTGVIENKAGSAGGNGIDARQRTELGDIRIDLAAGSTIDVSAAGGRGVLGQIFKHASSDDPQSGDIIIDARGTIKAAVKRKSGSRYQGAGIVAKSSSSGAIRIASSGTIETVQAPAIIAWSYGAGNPLDDPVTPAIEGNLIDVAGGRIETRGSSAIVATGNDVTIRVAEGATVRAEGMAGPGAITKAQYESCIVEKRLGCRYAEGAKNGMPWWIRSDTDNNDKFDTILPFVNGITVVTGDSVSRVLIDGVVEVVEGSPVTADESDEELGYADGHGVYFSYGGTVVVGGTGRISVSTASGAAIRSATGDLAVAVMGTVDGDIQGLGSGEHTVTVSEGGVVTGTIHSATGDLAVAVMGTVDGDIRGLGLGEHTVSVSEGGVVTGTIHLAASAVTVGGSVGHVLFDRGGTVTVLASGRIGDVDGVSILSETGELVVVIVGGDGRTDGAAPRLTGRIVERGGAPEMLFQAAGETQARPLGGLGTDKSAPSGAFDVGVVADADGVVRLTSDYAPRSRVYEALPSVLLGLNGLPAYRDRLTAARSPNGAWARVWAAGGEREAERSTSTARLAYDHDRSGARLGVDIPLGEDAVGGVSAHRVRGKADLSGGHGKIEATGTGLGVSGAWRFDEGVYVDAQASATWYEADLASGLRGSLKSGTRGFGYALGLETGRRLGLGPGPLGDLTATPRARLVWSEVDMDDFTDSVGSRVSLERGRSVTGRAGVDLETSIEGGGLLFGSVELEREFAGKTRIDVSGSSLVSETGAMRARIELGGAYAWDGGAYALRGSTHVVQGRRDNRDWGGGLSLAVRF